MASLIIKDYHKFDYDILVKDYGFERIDDDLLDYKIYQREIEDSYILVYNDGDVSVQTENESGIIDQDILCVLYKLIQDGVIEVIGNEQ